MSFQQKEATRPSNKVSQPCGGGGGGETATYLPHTHHGIGDQDHNNDDGLNKRRRGLLSFLEPGQDLVGKRREDHDVVERRSTNILRRRTETRANQHIVFAGEKTTQSGGQPHTAWLERGLAYPTSA